MNQPVKLVALTTAFPRYIFYHDEVAGAAREMFGKRYSAFARMAPVFLTAGIKKRHAARPLELYSEPLGRKGRTAAYHEVGTI